MQVHKSKGCGSEELSLFQKLREGQHCWINAKRGNIHSRVKEAGRNQMIQDLLGHSKRFVFCSKCRGKTLEDFKQGSIMISSLYKKPSLSLVILPTRSNRKG